MKNFNDRKSRLSLFFPQQHRKKMRNKKKLCQKICTSLAAQSTFFSATCYGTPIVLQFNSIFTFGRFVYHHKWCQSIYHLTAHFFSTFFFSFRVLLYQAVEDLLYKFGLEGKACLLRAICEMHESPLIGYGFFGEVLELFLT